jgi:nitroimidazol reductase NimA-like FMN-containing flavoprotein (pyridoxamine 5'-phosphate oxidase superfamily)
MPGLSPDDVRAFLSEPGHLVRIATVDQDGAPSVVPAWFVFQKDRIYVTPRERSAWWAHIQNEPRVAMTIDEDAAPYRKVALRATATIDHRPGDDDAWRDLYRTIAKRYTPEVFATAYVNATIHEPRALISVPCDPASVTTWRMPLPGEDPAGVWADRYYHRKPDPSEWVPD